MRRVAALSSFAACTAIGTAASANPRPFPFTYTAQTLAEGEAEIEQYADLTPSAVLASTGSKATILATELQTEFEYGITDRVELGLYVTLAPRPSDSYQQIPALLWNNGLKQRIRYRLGEPGEWPVDVALYGEVAEMQDEIELEAKVILERRFGDLRLATNLWAEHEFYLANGKRDWVLNPTLAATYQVTPVIHPGVEGWMRAELEANQPTPGPRPFPLGPHVYVGPTLLLNFGTLWWSSGAYLRVTDFDRSPTPGEGFGPVWFRTVIGISL